MKRDAFIKRSAAILASLAIPYFIPSGLAFKPTGKRRVNHVVFCLYAGGIRNLESVQKAEGNLMLNTLHGKEAVSKDIESGMTPLPPASSTPLQTFGTLFRNFRYDNFQTNHYNGHVTALVGKYAPYASLTEHPDSPTIFEYYRKFSSSERNQSKAWWITDRLGPYPVIS